MNARLAVAGLALVLLPACGITHRANFDLALSSDFVVGAPLEVVTENGDVEIVIDPGVAGLTIEATTHGAGDSEAEARARAEAIKVDVAVRDGRTVVRPVYPQDERRMNEGCSFKVRVAASSDIYADTSNGDVELMGSTGSARLETSNGSVHVTSHQGPLEVDSSNGGLVLEDVEGEINAETSNGSIVLRTNGDLSQPVRMSSSNGDLTIDVEQSPAGTLRAETSNGSIEVRGLALVPESGVDRRTRDIDFGRPGPHHVASTSNGSIRVHVGSR